MPQIVSNFINSVLFLDSIIQHYFFRKHIFDNISDQLKFSTLNFKLTF